MALGNNFSSRAILDGNRTANKLRGPQEDTFSTINNVGRQTNTKNLSQTGTRRAIDRSFDQFLKNNPEEDAALATWMKAFGFHDASAKLGEHKMNGINPWLNEGEGDTMGPETAAEAETQATEEGEMA